MRSLSIQHAVECALETICANLGEFATRYPDDTTFGNVYRLRQAHNGFAEGDNYGWTTGFWPGMLWLAYELSGNEAYRQGAEQHIASYARRIAEKIDVDTHDLGFLYTLSGIAPWQLTGDARGREIAIQAAECLMTRYLERIGVFQAWGQLDDPAMRGNTIIDSLMNMPLLYWASVQTGDARFAQAAHRHAALLRDHMVRPDSTTFHTFYWDVETGQPRQGGTAQGHAGDSCWARGQAWAIYGFTLNYRYIGDATLLHTAQRCADYFLDHLPDDHVPYWDLAFDHASGEERDSSAAAIAVCGLHEMLRHLPEGAQTRRYASAAQAMLDSLVTRYAACHQPGSNALLLHGVYDKPKGIGVDEGNLWGDYFYLEALTRFLRPDWQTYW